MQSDLTPLQLEQLKALGEPFDPSVVRWRVLRRSLDRTRGLVAPYADQRAYIDRLHSVVTPAGWTRISTVTTLSPVPRVKDNLVIQTGKICVNYVVTIHSLGTHDANGEMWADDDQATAMAAASAFKRACACFGVGRYLYNLGEAWVDLDENGLPRTYPDLPDWAKPPRATPDTRTANVPRENAKGTPGKTTGNQKTEPKLDASLTHQIESLRNEVGNQLYFEVFRKGGPARSARYLPSIEAQKWVLEKLHTVRREIERARSLAEQVHEQEFFKVCDRYHVRSVTKIPSWEVLTSIVKDLHKIVDSQAA